MAWRDTPRTRAASAWEIHSSAASSDKCLDIDKIFVIPSNLDSTPNALIGKEAHGETQDGRVFWWRRWRRRLNLSVWPSAKLPSAFNPKRSVRCYPECRVCPDGGRSELRNEASS